MRATRQDSQPSASGSSDPGKPVSILIVNYNGAGFLPGCLDSLANVSYQPCEVVLVDNASTDESLEVLRRYPWVKVIRSDRNRGFAGGNNYGLPHCSGRYVLLLNNDTVVVPGFLGPLVEYLDRNSQVGVVQGKMLLPRFGNSLDVCGSFLTVLGFPYHYGLYKPDGPNYQHSYPVFSGKGACLMFRRELVEHTGGFLFDEDFFCYYEETDFCHRAWLAGFEVHFVDGPAILHLMGGTAGGPQADFVLKHYLRNMAFSLMANLSFVSRVSILPLFFSMLCVSMIAAGVTFRWPQFAAHWGAIANCIRQYGRIRERRRLVGRLRRKEDKEIFLKVLRTPRADYFLKTFAGKLDRYDDPELP